MAITQIKFRRGTTAEWATFNPVLAAGEPGVDTDTDRLKIGDGEKSWTDLPFQSSSPDQLTEALAQLDASLDGIEASVAAAQAAQTAAEAAAATASNVGTTSDANIAGQVNVANSLTRAALNALYGRVDRIDVRAHGAVGNGTTDDRAAIQAAMDLGVSTGRVVLVPAGYRFRCTGGLFIDSNLKMQIDGVLVRDFTGLSGANGFLGNRSGAVKVNDVTLWGSGGIDLVDPATNVGNQVYLYGDRITVQGLTVYRFSQSRAWNLGGDYMKIIGCGFYGGGFGEGNGGMRYYGGTGFRAIGCHGISGDDAFQLVPAGGDQNPLWGLDTVDAFYIGCHGDSTNGRVFIIASQIGTGPDVPPDGTVAMTVAVRDSGFIGVTGKGGQMSGGVLKNANSSGPIENILIEGCNIDMANSTEVAVGDVYLNGMLASQGIGPIRNITFRNCHIRNPTGVSYRVHLDNVYNVKFIDCYAERSTRTPTAYVIESAGTDIKIIGGVYDGKDSTLSQVIRFASTGGGVVGPVRPSVEDATIKGIGQGQNGITFTAATAPRIENTRFEAAATATTAKAFNANSTTTDLAYSRLDLTGLPGTSKFTNNAIGVTLTGVNNRGLAGESLTTLAAEFAWARPTGVKRASLNRTSGTVATVAALASGRLTLQAVELVAGDVINSISFFTGSTAAVGLTNQWFSLWDASRNRLALTADDTTTAWTAGIKTLALTTPYTVTATGLYYCGVLVVATTVPTMVGTAAAGAFMNQTPLLCGSADSGLTNPASAPAVAAAMANVSTVLACQVQ